MSVSSFNFCEIFTIVCNDNHSKVPVNIQLTGQSPSDLIELNLNLQEEAMHYLLKLSHKKCFMNLQLENCLVKFLESSLSNPQRTQFRLVHMAKSILLDWIMLQDPNDNMKNVYVLMEKVEEFWFERISMHCVRAFQKFQSRLQQLKRGTYESFDYEEICKRLKGEEMAREESVEDISSDFTRSSMLTAELTNDLNELLMTNIDGYKSIADNEKNAHPIDTSISLTSLSENTNSNEDNHLDHQLHKLVQDGLFQTLVQDCNEIYRKLPTRNHVILSQSSKQFDSSSVAQSFTNILSRSNELHNLSVIYLLTYSSLWGAPDDTLLQLTERICNNTMYHIHNNEVLSVMIILLYKVRLLKSSASRSLLRCFSLLLKKYPHIMLEIIIPHIISRPLITVGSGKESMIKAFIKTNYQTDELSRDADIEDSMKNVVNDFASKTSFFQPNPYQCEFILRMAKQILTVSQVKTVVDHMIHMNQFAYSPANHSILFRFCSYDQIIFPLVTSFHFQSMMKSDKKSNVLTCVHMLLIIQQASVNGFDEYETIWNADIFKCLTSLVSMDLSMNEKDFRMIFHRIRESLTYYEDQMSDIAETTRLQTSLHGLIDVISSKYVNDIVNLSEDIVNLSQHKLLSGIKYQIKTGQM